MSICPSCNCLQYNTSKNLQEITITITKAITIYSSISLEKIYLYMF